MNTIMRIRQAMPFSDVRIVGEYLSLGDVLLAVIVAVVGVWVYRNIYAFIRGFFATHEEYRQVMFIQMIRKYQAMFPKTTLSFGGETFTRGMLIRVVTKNQQTQSEETFEGRFIGMDDNKTICVVTRSNVVADILDNILEIIQLDDNHMGETK